MTSVGVKSGVELDSLTTESGRNGLEVDEETVTQTIQYAQSNLESLEFAFDFKFSLLCWKHA